MAGTSAGQTTSVSATPTPVSPVSDDIVDDKSNMMMSVPWTYVAFGFIVLVIMTALLVWFGGIRRIRRVLGFRDRSAEYKRVDDLEK